MINDKLKIFHVQITKYIHLIEHFSIISNKIIEIIVLMLFKFICCCCCCCVSKPANSKPSHIVYCVGRWWKANPNWRKKKREKKPDVEGEIQSTFSTIWTWNIAIDIRVHCLGWKRGSCVLFSATAYHMLSFAIRNRTHRSFPNINVYCCWSLFGALCSICPLPIVKFEKKEKKNRKLQERRKKNLIGDWHHKNKNDIPVCVRALCLTSMKWWLHFCCCCLLLSLRLQLLAKHFFFNIKMIHSHLTLRTDDTAIGNWKHKMNISHSSVEWLKRKRGKKLTTIYSN